MENQKSLITITTCNRLSEVKKYIWEYLQFVNRETEFDFVLALDGYNQEYIDFAAEFELPLIYSDEREGVGLSKNRVLTQFPDYAFYFFLDDDIELLDSALFRQCITLMTAEKYHHLCGNHTHTETFSVQLSRFEVTHSLTGGGYFTCYTQQGIQTVGGFHTLFARYRRYGHSEHSYRFLHSGLQASPFIFFREGLDALLIHSPESVTPHKEHAFNQHEWVQEEHELIHAKTSYFPLQTLCPYHFNHKLLGYNETVANFLATNSQKYPLTRGKERRIALAEHYALRISKTSDVFQKIALFLKSVRYSPTNVALKHYIKTQLFGRRNR
jgi:hypothetical protein